jgi:LysR family cys regulon transcriptional activator
VRDFRVAYPDVRLHMHQGTAHQVAQMLMEGSADIGVATEGLGEYAGLVALPCYRWTHAVIVPPGHPLAQPGQPLTLAELARHPIITYEAGYTGRSHIDEAFQRHGLEPQVVLSAMDADVIKTYVELGLGVGIVAAIAYDEERDRHLTALDARHLFAANMTRLAVRRGSFLREYVYAFIETFASPLNRALVQRALQGAPGTDFNAL